MHTRTLGDTGIKASILGMGSSPFRNGTVEVCAELLTQALDCGVTYYDTARSYPNGEATVAKLQPVVKNRLVIATKTGARCGKRCVQDLETSMRTLNRGWIDVWMTHMIKTEEEYEACTSLGGFCDIAIAAKKAGFARATGASFHAPTPLILRAIEERAFDVVMFQFNLIGRETVFGSSIRSYREVLLPAARANGVGVVVMKVMAGGELREGAPKLNFVAGASGGTVQAGAVRYAAMNPGIATAVVGMSTTYELLDNVKAVADVDDSHMPVFDDWTERVAALSQTECTRCGACLPVCPEQIEIPKIFRLHDQLRCFGMEAVPHYRYSQLSRSALSCTECRKCEVVCPEKFDIAASLKMAHGALSQRVSPTPAREMQFRSPELHQENQI